MSIFMTKELIATTASASTILQLLSGILVCKKFMKKGATNDVSGYPFLSGFLSCSLWLGYGYVIDDWAVMLVNTVGVLLMASYIIIYYVYTPRKFVILRELFFVMMILIATQIYARHESDKELAKSRLGIIVSCATLIFFASPLTNLAHVIKVKSSESLPFPIIFMSLIVSAQWVIYGLILHNSFIVYPNGLGCILSVVQLSLFGIYPRR